MLAMIFQIALLIASFFILPAHAEDAPSKTTEERPAFEKTFHSTKIKSLEVHSGTGTIEIHGTETKEVHVRAEEGSQNRNCAVVVDEKGDKLLIRTRTKGFFSDGTCHYDFQISIPCEIDVSVNVGSGEVAIDSTRGSLNLAVGSGNVKGTVASSEVLAKIGSGNLELDGLEGNASVKIGTGDSKLEWTSAPAGGNANLMAGTGNAKFVFPSSAKVNAQAHVGTGTFSNDFANNPESAFEFRGKVGSGSISIVKASSESP